MSRSTKSFRIVVLATILIAIATFAAMGPFGNFSLFAPTEAAEVDSGQPAGLAPIFGGALLSSSTTSVGMKGLDQFLTKAANAADSSQDVPEALVTVLPGNNSTSQNGRAPQGGRLFINTKYLILESELTASGFSGAVTSIGWRWNVPSPPAAGAPLAQSVQTTGSLRVYLLDTDPATVDLANSTVDPAGFTKIIDSTITLPTDLTEFNIDVPAGGPGTSVYTHTPGRAVTVLFEYQTTTPLSSVTAAPVVFCTNLPAGNMLATYQSQTTQGNAGAFSAFRPETRFGNTVGGATPTPTPPATPTPTPTPTPTLTPTPTPTPTPGGPSPTPSPSPSCTPQQLLQDGGFEAGPPWPAWSIQASTNFGTPLCDVPSCTTGGGASPPRTGAFWAWFGGVPAVETATLGQIVTIPAGNGATLNFWMRAGTVSAPFTDVLNVRVDGAIVQTFTEPSSQEPGYTLRSIDLGAFANGASHTILFEYIGPTTGTGSFVIDDMSLDICGSGGPTPSPTPSRIAFDYDGDSSSDFSVFRPSDGIWYIRRSTAGPLGIQFGLSTDKIAPADYDGDGKTDIAVYRPSEGQWYILNSSNGTVVYSFFGLADDLPAPADYDGDHKADICVFRPSTGTWYRQNSSDGSFFALQFGLDGDRPTIGDFDGDGKSDIGIWRPSSAEWYHLRSASGTVFGERFGLSDDKIVQADYDGDGKTDIAIWRPSNGDWWVKNSATSTYSVQRFGLPSDIPVPADYNGDHRTDRAVFRPGDATWRIINALGNTTSFQWGLTGDRPTPAAFLN